MNEIPDYQSLMLPFLKFIQDRKEYASSEVVQALADQYQLTDEQREELLPSGTQAIINNRVGWAKFYLERAGLVKTVRRGVYQISPGGLQLLQSDRKNINVAFLKTLPKFRDWYAENVAGGNKGNKNDSEDDSDTSIETSKTPDELINEAYKRINEELAFEVLDKVKSVTPAKFEDIVVDLLKAMGYGGPEKNGKTLGKSGDGGVDGVIREDKLGLEMIYVQAKRWENQVTISSVRDFAGALLSKRSKKGVFITTSHFPKSAYEFTKSIDQKIILIDGKELAKYMIEFQVGVSKKEVYTIKRLDTDYFEEF